MNLVEEDEIHSYGNKLFSVTFDIISSVHSERQWCKCWDAEENVCNSTLRAWGSVIEMSN